MFSKEELKRYNRQMLMQDWGEETQKKLKKSTVFIAGAGGLGSPTSIYLAVAGIGNIRICDYDAPDWSNLNRQILHNHNRIGVNKAISARETLKELNPDINVTAFTDKIVAENIADLVGEADIIVDCMDNFPTRYVLNDVGIKKGIPLVFGSIWGMEERLSFISPPETPCLKCIYPEAPPSETFPVVGATPGVIGSLQALEVIKYLTGIGENLKGKLMVWNGNKVEFKNYRAYKDPECPVCGGL
ncbi:MAG: HesA/MoeB/ThiF family protein [Nitrospirae bacterium]|nr:HesA/MoeB/ThiF family protein [Nitrospirota bacterium]